MNSTNENILQIIQSFKLLNPEDQEVVLKTLQNVKTDSNHFKKDIDSYRAKLVRSTK